MLLVLHMIFFYVMLRSYNYVAGCSYQHQNPLPLTLQEVLRKNGDGNTHSGRREEQHPVSRQHPGHSVCADKVRPYRILTPRALARTGSPLARLFSFLAIRPVRTYRPKPLAGPPVIRPSINLSLRTPAGKNSCGFANFFRTFAFSSKS
jgi:hypothetical protein